MKTKHTNLLLALGFCLQYLAGPGGFFHRREAQVLLLFGTCLKVTGLLWLAYKVIRYDGFRKFMNS